jgi:hypothetical protein
MKIRNSFVSNSSSTSFIIKQQMTIAQVATIMMYGVRRNWMDDELANAHDSESDFNKSFEVALQWLEDNQDYNKPISFPYTTNYETFIWYDKNLNRICVETCNNQQEYWVMLCPNYEEIYELSQIESEQCWYFDRHKSDEKFLDLKTFKKILSY